MLRSVVRVIARAQGDVTLLSVLSIDDDEVLHRYRLRGGPDDGIEFRTLSELVTYATVHGLQLTEAD